MAQFLQALDREWSELATSPRARRALIRWTNINTELAGNRVLTEVLVSRRDPVNAEPVLRALAVLLAQLNNLPDPPQPSVANLTPEHDLHRGFG